MRRLLRFIGIALWSATSMSSYAGATNVLQTYDIDDRDVIRLPPDTYVEESVPGQIESSELERTLITPHLEEEIIYDRNSIYCSAFQIAWNTLQDEIIKDSILLIGAEEIADLLNKQLSTRSDLSEECYVAMADKLTDEFLQCINDALKEKFGEDTPPEVDVERRGMGEILSYAYLAKNLEFAEEFEQLKSCIYFRSDSVRTRVTAFGIREYSDEKHKDLGKQVSVIDYKDRNDFIISLSSKSANDEIILAKIKPEETLLATITAISERMAKTALSSLREEETLQIPRIDFNVKHRFKELEGKRLGNEGWEGWFVSRAIQWIRFQLDRKGAVLKSGVKYGAAVGLDLAPRRKFVFDKPFLIYLKQKDGKYPYFAMWIGNTELLLEDD